MNNSARTLVLETDNIYTGAIVALYCSGYPHLLNLAAFDPAKANTREYSKISMPDAVITVLKERDLKAYHHLLDRGKPWFYWSGVHSEGEVETVVMRYMNYVKVVVSQIRTHGKKEKSPPLCRSRLIPRVCPQMGGVVAGNWVFQVQYHIQRNGQWDIFSASCARKWDVEPDSRKQRGCYAEASTKLKLSHRMAVYLLKRARFPFKSSTNSTQESVYRLMDSELGRAV